MSKPKTIDEYIAGFPQDVRPVLEQLRTAMKKLIPGAEEAISYGIPVFNLNGKYVIYFAGYKNHVSVYPAPRRHEEFKEVLSAYKGGKGTVQFPLSEPLPMPLINKIIRFRVGEVKNEADKKATAKKTASKKSVVRKPVAKKKK